jgi:hypothetical protein
MKKSFEALDGNTTNCKVAATAIALDIPLDVDRPCTIASGDGISGTRVVWHFSGPSKDGNTIGAVIKAWSDHGWQARNPDHEVTRIKLAFEEMTSMAAVAKTGAGKYSKCVASDKISHTSTALAATMVAIGHPCLGFNRNDFTVHWHFNRAAAADFSLWLDPLIHEKLPEAKISYIKCALLNWKELITEANSPQLTAVKHGARTAFVGKNDSAQTQSILEKLLFRK